jgi:hypothetical protein
VALADAKLNVPTRQKLPAGRHIRPRAAAALSA